MRIAINKELIQDMCQVEFPGAIHVIDSTYHLKEAVAVLRRQDIVGFDTETRPSFRRGPMRPPALLQLSTMSECFLFRLNKIKLPDVLVDYLTDAACRKVGLSITDDFMALNRITPIEPAGFVELQEFVKRYGIIDNSLQKVYAIIFGEKIAKSQRLTNWEAPALTEAQQRYAAIDAWACSHIYYHLTAGNFHPEESPYVLEENDNEHED